MTFLTRPLIVSVLLVTVLPRIAAAQSSSDVDRARTFDERAAAFVESDNFEAALEAMVEAQDLVPSAPRLYNMAVCHERLAHNDEAVALYRRFISAPHAPPERRDRALARILALQSEERDEPSSETTSDEINRNETEPGSRRLPRSAFWASLGATLGLGITTAVLGGVTWDLQDEFLHTGLTQTDERARELESTGENLAIATDVFLVLTAAAAVATLIIGLLTEWRSQERARRQLTIAWIGQ